MKPSEKQKKVIDLIMGQLSFWSSTNDIMSSTHQCDIDEEINMIVFDEILTEDEAENLEDILYDLYFYIKTIKE